jgi:hypothetical protein
MRARAALGAAVLLLPLAAGALPAAGRKSALKPKLLEIQAYDIKTSFEYNANGHHDKTDSSIAINDKNNAWMTLSPPKGGVTLLGRVAKMTAKIVELEYIVIDTNLKNPIVVTPGIKAVIGQKANLVINEPRGEKIMISAFARPFKIQQEQ